jgi:MSHA biogenesis protein MshN
VNATAASLQASAAPAAAAQMTASAPSDAVPPITVSDRAGADPAADSKDAAPTGRGGPPVARAVPSRSNAAADSQQPPTPASASQSVAARAALAREPSAENRTAALEPPAAAGPTAPPAGRKTYSAKQLAGKLIAEATTLERQGHLDEAKQRLRQVLAADPRDVTARQMLVQLDIDTGRLDDALVLLEDGLQQQAGHPGMSWTLARLKAESGDASGAITLLETARGPAPNDPQLNAFLGALLLRGERYAEAVQAYLVALRADPANAAWLLGIGAALEGTGNASDAREAYLRAEAVSGLTSEQAEFVGARLEKLRQWR